MACIAARPSALRAAATLLAPVLLGRSSAPLFRSFASAGASNVVEVNDDQQYDAEISSHGEGLAIVDFTATWCGPCKRIAPLYDQLSVEHTSIKFLKVDIDNDELQGTVGAAKISSVPTFTFMKGGKAVRELKGADAAGLKQAIQDLS